MKTLINNIKTFLTTDITTAKVIEKGLPEEMQLIPFINYPYVAIGDGGERVENIIANTSQNRIYTVLIIMAVFNTDKELALDNILDLCNSVKTSIENLTNRQKDSHNWGISIIPFDWADEKGFYMGRSVSIEFIELENKIFDY